MQWLGGMAGRAGTVGRHLTLLVHQLMSFWLAAVLPGLCSDGHRWGQAACDVVCVDGYKQGQAATDVV
jgi:hypothetical protein